MKRLFLVVLALALLSGSLPVVGPKTRPYLGPVPGWFDAAFASATAPLDRWTARSEASHLLRTLARWQSEGKTLPKQKEFARWAQKFLAAERAGLDPWGESYVLHYYGDSVAVASPGPDRTPHSEDDIRVSSPWR